MLKYIWMVIQDLFLTVTFVTLIHAVLAVRFGKRGTSFHRFGIAAGVLPVAQLYLTVKPETSGRIVISCRVFSPVKSSITSRKMPLGAQSSL